MLPVIAVRPYDVRIRNRVLALLELAGCVVRPDDVIPAGTPDEAAIAFVLARPHTVLLVPFHAHQSAHGDRLDGLNFVRRLRAAAPRRYFRVVMPVSRFASAAVVLSTVPDEVLLIDEDTLDTARTARRLRAHVTARPAPGQ